LKHPTNVNNICFVFFNRGPISSKPDELLFEIDKSATKKGTIEESVRLLTKKERRQNPKPLQCFAALRNTSCVPDPIAKR
jgi:hypothetical protein